MMSPSPTKQSSDQDLQAPTRLLADERVQASLSACHAITRGAARNFYHGLKLTPEPKRSAGYALYAYMRQCDDLADGELGEATPDPATTRRQIEAFRAQTQLVVDAPTLDDLPAEMLADDVWPAFWYIMHAYPIDPACLHDMLNGQIDDLTRFRYETFEELYRYCYRVASTVGLVCIAIWGHDGDIHIPKLAEYRGIALQLTNILRDITEDAGRGRIYLPLQELAQFGLTENDILSGEPGPGFTRFMVYQVERARSYYTMSATLEQHLDAQCRPTSWAMTRIYREILDQIALRPRRVLTSRVRLSGLGKCRIALSAAWKRTWAGREL